MASTTAERWWVRIGARWIARIDSVKGHLSLAFQGMTGVGIASGALKYFGLEQFVAPFIFATGLVMLGFAYLYSEGGVWNQMNRDRQDLSTNFATPRDKIDDTLIGVSVFTAVNGRPPTEEEADLIEEAVHTRWEKFRDGVDIE